MLNQIIKPITKELKVFDSKYKDSLSSDVKLLILISDYILKNPGKKIRPILLLLVSKMIGDINNKTYSSCILIELLHTATLIHDDVVDDAHFRRGKFSVSSLWKNKIAVLVGDYLLSKGLSLGLKDNDINILKYTSKAVENISEGEIYQMQKSRDLDLNEDEYFEIIKRKTGSLFGCCFQLAAVSNNLTEKNELQKLYDIGEKIGIIFQIKDDILDYNKSNLTGKLMGNDLKESKINLPLLHTLKKASIFENQQILKILNKKKILDNEILFICKLVYKNNGIEFSKNKIDILVNELINDLQIFSDSKYKRSLIDLINYIKIRTK